VNYVDMMKNYFGLADIHNSWLHCFTNPLKLRTRVSLLHRQPYVSVGRRRSPR